MDHATRGARTLVISTDPAPSLGDVLELPLSGAPRRVPLRRGALHAVEINPHKAIERWLRPRRSVLETIALRGTWLDESDVRRLLKLSLPGIDELAALLEVLRFGASRAYDVIVVDTAPTGHTLRMLAMPQTLAAVATVFDHMQSKHRVMVDTLRGVSIEDEADLMIRELQQDAQTLTDLLRDQGTTHVSLVTLPEDLAVEETLDAVRSLLEQRIPVARVIVNRATGPPPQRCRWCDARRRTERRAMTSLAEKVASLARAERRPIPQTTLVTARQKEPVGMTMLRKLAVELRGEAAIRSVGRTTSDIATRIASVPIRFSERVRIPSARLLLFGGKGGVGKTTCAAAAALQLARSDPSRRILLVSTDPAHSLGDVLAVPLGDVPRGIPRAPGNLQVRELDASRALEPIRSQYAASIDALFERLGRGSALDATYDRVVMHDLLDLAPPGLDELAAVLNLVDLVGNHDASGEYDALVMDTAPTGHALRLLEMPEAVHEWTKALMSILLKYQPVVGLGELGGGLLRLSRGLGRLRAILQDPHETQFIPVTRAAALPRAETRRLLASLRRLNVRVPAIVVNAVGAGECSRCAAIVRDERQEIDRLQRSVRNASSGLPMIVTPAAVPPPIGVSALESWRGHWRTSS